jgi:hypothetical protein
MTDVADAAKLEPDRLHPTPQPRDAWTKNRSVLCLSRPSGLDQVLVANDLTERLDQRTRQSLLQVGQGDPPAEVQESAIAVELRPRRQLMRPIPKTSESCPDVSIIDRKPDPVLEIVS